MSYLIDVREVAPEPVENLTATGAFSTAKAGAPGGAVGLRGRWIFSAFQLWRRANDPRLERFYWLYLKPVFAAALILWYTPRYAGIVRRRFGVPVLEQIAQQCRLGFRDWVNPRCYYFHEHYRRRGPVNCDAYVMRHEIKEGLLRSLHKLRPKPHGARINLGHKLDFASVCKQFSLPTPPIAAVAKKKRIDVIDPAALEGDLFLKPEKGRGAIGAKAFLRLRDGRFKRRMGSESLADLLDRIARGSGARAKILQPMLRNHPDLADLAEQSLVTMRIITCFTPDERPVVTHAMLRTISKLEPDWPGSEEYAAPIDVTSGRLGTMCGDSAIGPQDWYDFHPVTCSRVAGRLVPQWSAIRELAVHAHRIFADRVIIGWDIALTPEGPVLIEGNSYPDTEFLQRVHRQAIGDSPLGPLLAFQLDRLERLRGRFGVDG